MLSKQSRQDVQDVLKKWVDENNVPPELLTTLLKRLADIHGTTALREVAGTIYTDWIVTKHKL